MVYDFEARDFVTGKVIDRVSRRKHKLLFIFTSSVRENTPKNFNDWMLAINDSLDKEVNEDDYTNPNIRRLFELIEKDKITPKERARMKDEYSQFFLKQEGFDEGYSEAQQEAEKKIREFQRQAERKIRETQQEAEKKLRKDKRETARNLKAFGIGDEQIALATGLSLDEVIGL